MTKKVPEKAKAQNGNAPYSTVLEVEFNKLFVKVLKSGKQLIFISGAFYSGKKNLVKKLRSSFKENDKEVFEIDFNNFEGDKARRLFFNELLINKKSGNNELKNDTIFIISHPLAFSPAIFDDLIMRKSFKIFVNNDSLFTIGKTKITDKHIRSLRSINTNKSNKEFKISEFLSRRETELKLENEQIYKNKKIADASYNTSSILEPFMFKNNLNLTLSDELEQAALETVYAPLRLIKASVSEELFERYLN